MTKHKPRAALVALSALTVIGWAGISTAGQSDAAEHRERGVEMYKAGDYQAAAVEFSTAYEIEPEPNTLFAWAQSERRAGECREAVRLYRLFLSLEPSAADARAARLGIKRCRSTADAAEASAREPAQEDVFEPSPGAGSSAEAEAEQPTSAREMVAARGGDELSADSARDHGTPASRIIAIDASSDRAWHHDKPGAVLVGGGVVLVTAGIGIFLSGSGLVEDLDPNATHDEVTGAESSTQRRRIIGGLTGALGAVAITLGVLRYRQVHKRQKKELSIQPYASPDSAGVMLQGRF